MQDMVDDMLAKKNLPVFLSGKYRLLYELSVRGGVGLGSDKILIKKEEGVISHGMMPVGSIVMIGEIRYLSVSVWGKCESGWICMYMNNTPYVLYER